MWTPVRAQLQPGFVVVRLLLIKPINLNYWGTHVPSPPEDYSLCLSQDCRVSHSWLLDSTGGTVITVSANTSAVTVLVVPALQAHSWESSPVNDHLPGLAFHVTEVISVKPKSQMNGLCTTVSKYTLSKLPSWAHPSANRPPSSVPSTRRYPWPPQIIIQETTGEKNTSHQVPDGKPANCSCSLCS